MIIYNVTINVEDGIHAEWLQWMQAIHIPDVLATGHFRNARICRVLVEEELGGTTYSVQYEAPDRASLDSYYREHAGRLRELVADRYGDRLVAFRTELEIISEH
ncbi:DUF4286 family protein [Robiginitalea sp. SC105]|uniref:DUF4286 family protein n=1 Tax=Robiginitalea sp. SC105 TaxID=2762332 RepID=UPI001639C763|nr:DUF4286 family protein [Robiginitalea sp. SC105]MBC2838537.1 DUF4286 family protein [Robiginitalea sp. SC105]